MIIVSSLILLDRTLLSNLEKQLRFLAQLRTDLVSIHEDEEIKSIILISFINHLSKYVIVTYCLTEIDTGTPARCEGDIFFKKCCDSSC